MLLSGLLLAAMTVACSTLAKRTQTATVLAYGFVLLFVLGTLVFYGATGVVKDETGNHCDPTPTAMLWVNKVYLTGSMIGGDQRADANQDRFDRSSSVASPCEGVRQTMKPRQTQVELGRNGEFGPNGPNFGNAQGGMVDGRAASPNETPPSGFENFTLYSVPSTSLLIVLFAWYGARRLRTPTATER